MTIVILVDTTSIPILVALFIDIVLRSRTLILLYITPLKQCIYEWVVLNFKYKRNKV